MNRSFMLSGLFVLALSAVILAGGLCGQASAFERKTTTTGANGKTATEDVTVNKTAGGYTRSATATGPDGKTASSQATGTYDPATKTWTKDKTVTGPNGKTKSWETKTTVTQ